MNPLDLFNQVKELIETKDFEAAKTFVAENQEQLGEYFSQAQQLISGSEGLDGLVSNCLLYTSPSPRDPKTSRMPSSA